MRDIYGQIYALRRALYGSGLSVWVARIDDAIVAGDTGTEILMGVRRCVQQLVTTEGATLTASQKSHAEGLVVAITRMLDAEHIPGMDAPSSSDGPLVLPSLAGGLMTMEVGFLECPAERAATWWTDELNADALERYGEPRSYELKRPGWHNLRDAQLALEPHIPMTRDAFVPIGEWTMFLNNGPNGTDTALLPRRAPEALGCRAFQAVCIPNKVFGAHPARVLSVFDPVVERSRHVSVMEDGGKWEFHEWGEPFAFEDTDAYLTRRGGSRLTPELLYSYLAELGVPYSQEPDWSGTWLMKRVDLLNSLRRLSRGRDVGYVGRAADYPNWRRSHPGWGSASTKRRFWERGRR